MPTFGDALVVAKRAQVALWARSGMLVLLSAVEFRELFLPKCADETPIR